MNAKRLAGESCSTHALLLLDAPCKDLRLGWALEVALALLDLHGAVLVVVDDAVGALGGAEADQLGDDLGDGVGVGANGSGAGAAA